MSAARSPLASIAGAIALVLALCTLSAALCIPARAVASPGAVASFVQSVADAAADGAPASQNAPIALPTKVCAYLVDTGKLYMQRTSEYDERGNLIGTTQKIYADEGSVTTITQTIVRDDSGLPVSMTVTSQIAADENAEPDQSATQTLACDSVVDDGRLLQTRYRDDEGNSSTTDYTYDQYGAVIAIREVTENPGTRITNETTYSAHGYITSRRTVIENTSGDGASGEPVLDYSVDYTWNYDENGAPVSVSSGDEALTVELDEAGNVAALVNEDGAVTGTFEYAVIEHPSDQVASMPIAIM